MSVTQASQCIDTANSVLKSVEAMVAVETPSDSGVFDSDPSLRQWLSSTPGSSVWSSKWRR